MAFPLKNFAKENNFFENNSNYKLKKKKKMEIFLEISNFQTVLSFFSCIHFDLFISNDIFVVINMHLKFDIFLNAIKFKFYDNKILGFVTSYYYKAKNRKRFQASQFTKSFQ